MTTVQTGLIPTITVAHRIRIAREVAGLDQGELADRAEMGRTTVVNYEQGHREPRRLYLRAIAEATGVDLHWLETGEAPDYAGASDDLRASRDSNPQPSGWEYDGSSWEYDRSDSESDGVWTIADDAAFIVYAEAVRA